MKTLPAADENQVLYFVATSNLEVGDPGCDANATISLCEAVSAAQPTVSTTTEQALSTSREATRPNQASLPHPSLAECWLGVALLAATAIASACCLGGFLLRSVALFHAGLGG